MATRMQQRRGTASEWASVNPVLTDGEIGVERDTGIFKFGDGATVWSALPMPFLRKAGGDVITASGVGVIPLTVKAATGQTANLFEARDGSNAVKASIGPAGAITGNGASSFTADAASTIPLIVKEAAGQTANVFEARDSANAVTSRIGPGGALRVGPGAPNNGWLSVQTTPQAEGIVVKVAAAQTANAFEVRKSDGTVMGFATGDGGMVFGGSYLLGGTSAANNSFHLAAMIQAATNRGLVIRGASAQTAMLAEFQDSAGVIKAKVRPNGGVEGSRSFFNNIDEPSFPALIARQHPSQGTNAFEVQDSSGAVLSYASNNGALVAKPTVNAQSGFVTTRPVATADGTTVNGFEHSGDVSGNSVFLRTRLRRYGGTSGGWGNVTTEIVRSTDATDQQRIGFLGTGGHIEYGTSGGGEHRMSGGPIVTHRVDLDFNANGVGQTTMHVFHADGNQVAFLQNHDADTGYRTLRAGGFSTVSTFDSKTNIREIAEGDALSIVQVATPVRYQPRDARLGSERDGFIAEDFVDVYPQAVTTTPNGTPTGIDYGALTPLLFRAIQELAARVAVLES